MLYYVEVVWRLVCLPVISEACVNLLQTVEECRELTRQKMDSCDRKQDATS